MTVARGAVLAFLAVAVVLVAVVLLGGNGKSTYRLQFQNAGQLVGDNDVQVGGRRVGRVTDINLTSDNQAEVEIEVEEPYAPLREGTRATIRATSLSGIANRYISLEMPPNGARRLDDGALITATDTTTPVDLDQLFNTLDPEARKSLQQVIQGSATQYKGRGRDANEAAKYFNPALSTTSRLVNELLRDQRSFESLLINGAKVTTALAERREDITGLVSNANRTTAAIGAEREALNESLGQLPDTLRRANTTFVNLRGTLTDLDVLVEESKPATRELAPFLRVLRPLVRDARPTISDLRRLIRAPGPNNDAIELLRKAPRLAQVATPSFRNTRIALEKSTPVLEFIRPYSPELTGWIREFGQASANYDANGHYARIQPIFNNFQFTETPGGGQLTAIPPENRLTGLQAGFVRRCPGGASQPPPDGSAPYRDRDGELDCDPRLMAPGP
jgi:phospholipid/cholesterol/gamma-HCH transport system substrate-binding protein